MRTLLVSYLIFLHAVLAISLYRNGQSQPNQKEQYIAARRQLLRNADANKPAGSIVFLGDSLTESLATANFPKAVNYGIGWSTTKDLNERIGDYDFGDVRAVVVMIGTNNATLKQAPDPLKLPSLPIIWYAVPPVDESKFPNTSLFIRDMNASFKAQCNSTPRCTFMELEWPDALLDDGVHLNERGREIWLRSLATALPE